VLIECLNFVLERTLFSLKFFHDSLPKDDKSKNLKEKLDKHSSNIQYDMIGEKTCMGDHKVSLYREVIFNFYFK